MIIIKGEDKHTYEEFDVWVLKIEIGFKEGRSFEIQWVMRDSGFSMDFISYDYRQKGIWETSSFQIECMEIDKLVSYYNMGKKVFVDWIRTVPELRLLHVLSPEKVVKDYGNIKEFKKNFMQLKG